MNWRKVESSNVLAIGWPEPGQIVVEAQMGADGLFWQPKLLLVMFKGGRVYGYLGVSYQRAVYMATRCPSVGAYIRNVVRPNFTAVRIPELDRDPS